VNGNHNKETDFIFFVNAHNDEKNTRVDGKEVCCRNTGLLNDTQYEFKTHISSRLNILV
jgi:hypothetical protein